MSRTCASTIPCSYRTPLGAPVEPEVKNTAARSPAEHGTSLELLVADFDESVKRAVNALRAETRMVTEAKERRKTRLRICASGIPTRARGRECATQRRKLFIPI